MTAPTRPCGRAEGAARLAIAEQFLDLADAGERSLVESPYRGNGLATAYVQAGIAACDALCCAELSEHAVGDNHAEAVALLRRVDPGGPTFAKDLAALLSLKSKASYGAAPIPNTDVVKARRAAERLTSAARERLGR